MFRRAAALGILGLGIAVGVFTLGVARNDPGYGFAGASAAAGVTLLLAGWALMAAGLGAWLRRPESAFGPLLAAAGFAWFLPEWNNPSIGSAPAFTVGICLSAACPSLVGHAILSYPSGRLRSVADRTAVLVSYFGSVVVLGFLPALFLDPSAACSECPDNLLAVSDRASLASDTARAGVYLGLVWGSALTLLAALRLGRAAQRPVVAAGAAYLALVTATFGVWLDNGFLDTGTPERRLWLGEAAALVGVALTVAWGWVRSRRARSGIARLVLALSQSPPPGGLRDALAQITGDPDLVLAYTLDGGRLVDARGRSIELPPDLESTPLVKDGHAVAVLAHAPGLLDEQLVDEIAATARLALENERLQAEVRARLGELCASRARIVAAGDAERRRLERDLHDGAQQRLVGLALSLGLLRSRLSSPELDDAEAELCRAIEELRALAHGIFPAVLSDEGFAAAIEALSEEARVPIQLGLLPQERFATTVETAAYTLVAEAATAATGALSVRADHSDGTLAVDVEIEGLDGFDLPGLEDRIGAVDGRLTVASDTTGRVAIHAELPCAS